MDLFRDEYRLPLPHLRVPLAAGAEHLFPLLLRIGLGTRFAALALLVITLTIQPTLPNPTRCYNPVGKAALHSAARPVCLCAQCKRVHFGSTFRMARVNALGESL